MTSLMMTHSPELVAAYDYCQQLANNHYENFPVASILLPAHLRQAVSVIYAFARTADDIADEGNVFPQKRLANLAEYEQQLALISQENYHGSSPLFLALSDVIKRYKLPIVLFQDLLSAFRQDVTLKRYPNEHAINDYCRRSANPIGRLLLLLNGEPSQLDLIQSDAICTALQLINFYQDIQQDLHEHNRIYIPEKDFAKFGLTASALLETDSSKLAPILREKYRYIQVLFSEGFHLGYRVRGRLGWEIRTLILSGMLTLKKLSSQYDHALYSRPRLSKHQLLAQSILALSPKIYQNYCQYSLNKMVRAA